jgi:hypothetical protein
MVKVFLHYKKDDKGEWINEERHFARLPCVGEYVALSTSSLLYRVYAVVHCPFEAEFEAEVFLHKPDSMTNVIIQRNDVSERNDA